MGSAAPASLPQVAQQPRPEIALSPEPAKAAPQTLFAAISHALSPEDLGAAVSAAVEAAGHPMAANLLSSGRWSFEGSQPAVQLAASEFTVKMTLGPEPLKAANAAATQALGRPAKLKLSGGGEASAAPNGKTPARRPGSSTSRVAEDPIVKKMQETFGAEIRTVIDYQNKK